MLVSDDDGTFIGIITKLDILRAFNKRPELASVTAVGIITPEVSTVNLKTLITKMIKMTAGFHIIRPPVCKDEKIVGVFSRGDIIRVLVEPELRSNI
jgi:CBS domain-containing protein